MIQKISSADFSALSKEREHIVIDVRTDAEVRGESLAGSRHLPLHKLSDDSIRQVMLNCCADDPVYLLCGSGVRAEKASAIMAGIVKNPIWVIDGGITALRQTDLSIRKSSTNAMTLERQVRIAAGVLVLLGVLLGAGVNPGFYALSAFVGAGLTFAGITDTCGMAILLARMPWNR